MIEDRKSAENVLSFMIDKTLISDTQNYDVLIVGSGIAGLMAAIEILSAGDELKLAIITKNKPEETNTRYAQGGLSAPIRKNDSKELYVKDTLAAGDGLCNEDAVKILAEESPVRIRELLSWDCNLDRVPDSEELDFGLEAAHSRARVVHCKDHTGDEVIRCLIEKLKRMNCDILDNYFCVDILKKKGKCTGVVALDRERNRLVGFLSKAIVLATGGCGQIYKNTTNPYGATGDGIAMAFRAGCEIIDMEFIQFHPTAIKLREEKDRLFLVSESLRGEGGVLVNSEGERFMSRYSDKKDLATRDVVSRAIWKEMSEGKNVYMDARSLGEEFMKQRFPTIYEACQKTGVNPKDDLIPITPAAHYCMGGVKTDVYGRTSIEGLFACGETSSCSLHGANRLASNSLTEALVFGHRTGKEVVRYTKAADPANAPSELETRGMELGSRTSHDTKELRKQLQEICWNNIGIIRNRDSIGGALEKLNVLSERIKEPILDVKWLELANMIVVASLIAESAMIREESRGTHYREDFPEKRGEWKKHTILVR